MTKKPHSFITTHDHFGVLSVESFADEQPQHLLIDGSFICQPNGNLVKLATDKSGYINE